MIKKIASYGKMSRLPVLHAWKRESKSNPSKSYVVQLHQDGVLTCNCKGWINRASRDCAHVKELLGEAQILLDYLDQEQSEELDKTAVRICISYKIDGQFGVDPDLDQTLRNLAEKYDGDSPSSGSGFGFRDIDFEFEDAWNAQIFKKEAKKIVGKRGHACSYEEDDNYYIEAVLSLTNQIFRENEQWIMDPNVKTQYPLPDPKDDTETLKFFKEYKRLGGRDEREKYTDNLRTFFKITFESYVNGDLSKPIEGEHWLSGDEPWMCFVGFMQSIEEAERYFKSVDNIHAYT